MFVDGLFGKERAETGFQIKKQSTANLDLPKKTGSNGDCSLIFAVLAGTSHDEKTHLFKDAKLATPAKSALYYLGPSNSFTHLAAIKFAGDGSHLMPLATIESVFDEVVRSSSSRGIVPIENSTDGRIVDTLARLIEAKVQVVGEVRLPIHHCLWSHPESNTVREIRSKPQALSQCRKYLAEHFPDAIQTAVSSTTAAAESAAHMVGIAAVASRRAGDELGLQLLAENIEDNRHNVTRFVVIATQPIDRTGDDKTSLLFQVPHRPGSLADAMMVFKTRSLNLTFIESFPSPGEPNEYQFFVELDGHQNDRCVASAINDLRDLTHRLVVLGSYPKA